MNDPLENKHDHAIANAKGWLSSILEMVEALNAADLRDDDEAHEKAEEAIHQSILSLEVKTGWFTPGGYAGWFAPGGYASPEEYRLLLSWGGPALQLVGKLNDHNEPDEWPRLEYQDWFTPWTEYEPAREHREALQKFASVFYYGE